VADRLPDLFVPFDLQRLDAFFARANHGQFESVARVKHAALCLSRPPRFDFLRRPAIE